MPKLPGVNHLDAVRALEKAGFHLRRQRKHIIDDTGTRAPADLWLALIALVVVLGLGSRRLGHRLPSFVATYAGDTLWATAAFLGIGLIFRAHQRGASPCWRWCSR